ncbi:hypothetical protein O181_000592 [Austropuccinia psidii MF-1]|uniref:Uncharacterized protein n=1 Tax=Austropuccinia psidii MF-1 TaxID=1389203 RepID=A0A9Q3B969_9BASI|nr:hypothetical protein [Austropuccinia psidii MF-1]
MMNLNSQKSISPPLAIPHESSDHWTFGTQPNHQMIANEFNVPHLSVSPGDAMNFGTQPHNNDDLTDDVETNNNNTNSRQQKRILGYMNQTAVQLGIYDPKFSILTLEKKNNDNSSWLKLIPKKHPTKTLFTN